MEDNVEASTLVSSLVNDLDSQNFACKLYLFTYSCLLLAKNGALEPNQIPRTAIVYRQTMGIPAKSQKCSITS